MKRQTRLSALIAIALAACNGVSLLAPTATGAPTPLPTATPLPPTGTAALTPTALPSETLLPTLTPTATPRPNPLSIPYMRRQSYPGSEVTIEETLNPGANYYRYIASYYSEGLKIYALLTVPFGDPPLSGWPVIVFNHGFIQPGQYKPTERYVAYVDAIARHDYIVFRPDYRGHGNSEGEATGGYRTPAYTIDVLNAVSSISRYPLADPDRIGMWGHSMGGQITLRAMVTSCCAIRAGSIWGGVVAPYWSILTDWNTPTPAPGLSATPSLRGWRGSLIAQYGTIDDNPAFWADISPNSFLADISGPLQIQHATDDIVVPYRFSEMLFQEMLDAKRTVYFFSYDGDDHDISQNFSTAMVRTIDFFDDYVKNR